MTLLLTFMVADNAVRNHLPRHRVRSVETPHIRNLYGA
jgi:hypothetical protein